MDATGTTIGLAIICFISFGFGELPVKGDTIAWHNAC